MTVAAQLFSIFAFGLVITALVFLGVMRAQEAEKRLARVRSEERPRKPTA